MGSNNKYFYKENQKKNSAFKISLNNPLMKPSHWLSFCKVYRYGVDILIQVYLPGPSCSKHRQLIELVSDQNVNCSSK